MASIGKRVDELGTEVHARVDSLGDYLRSQRENAQLSLRQLAVQAGVSNPYLSQVERGLRKPSAEVLQQIAKGLRISAEALYIRAGILDSERLPDVEAAIAADPELNDRQRRALLDIYASFRAENRRAAGSAAADAPSEPDDEASIPDEAPSVAAVAPSTEKAVKKATPRKRVAKSAPAAETTTKRADGTAVSPTPRRPRARRAPRPPKENTP